jgi:hypothetical protein
MELHWRFMQKTLPLIELLQNTSNFEAYVDGDLEFDLFEEIIEGTGPPVRAVSLLLDSVLEALGNAAERS